MSRNELAGDVLAGCSGNVVQLWQRQTYAEVTVSHNSSVKCVAWNRNNKVVASGCQDGVIQLCYSTGKLMSVLRGVEGASLGSLNSLDWSMGSKFLAAGSDSGSVFVWDLKVSKGYKPLGRQQDGPITSLRYHPDDTFLAVSSAGASGAVSLYDLQGAELGALSCHDTSAKYSIQATPGETIVAVGTEQGGVVVWDWQTQQLVEHYKDQHAGAAQVLSFIPLKPSVLYSAGADGKLVLQDRRSVPAFSTKIDVGVPLTALSIREDYSSVAVGTSAGTVLLYDPRQMSSPLRRLKSASGRAVTDLHWQHCYSSLSSRMRGSSSSKSKLAGSAAASREPTPRGVTPRVPSETAAAAQPPLRRESSGSGMPPLPLGPRPSRQSSGMSALFDNTPRTARDASADPAPADAAAAAAGAVAAGAAAQAARAQAGSAAAGSAAPTPMMTPMQPSLGPAFGTGANPMLNITPLTGMAPLRTRAAATGLQHDLDQPSSGSSTPTANGSGNHSALLQALQQRSQLQPLDAEEQQQAAPPRGSPAVPPLPLPAERLQSSPSLAGPEIYSPAASTMSGASLRSARLQRQQQQPQAPGSGRGLQPGDAAGGAAAADVEVQQMDVEDSAVLDADAKLRKAAAAGQVPGAGVLSARQGSEEEQWYVKAVMPGAEEDGSARSARLRAAAAENSAPNTGRSTRSASSAGFSFGAAAMAQLERGTPDTKLGGATSARRGREAVAARPLDAAGIPRPTDSAVTARPVDPSAQQQALPHSLREDILALHLDILQQFQVQQEQVSGLVAHVVERQDALAAEVRSLRLQLQELLQTRNDFLWL